MRRATILKSLFFVFFLIGTLFTLPMFGKVFIPPEDVLYQSGWGNALFGEDDTVDPVKRLNHDVYWQWRFPRTLLAMLAGAGLSLCGMVFQALFRNPLATPYTLGVASGAAFGVAVFTIFGGILSQPLALWFFRKNSEIRQFGMNGDFFSAPFSLVFSFAGALLAMGLVYLLSLSRKTTGERMLLAGVAVNFFFSSLILFLQYISDPAQTFRILRFVMGSLEGAPPEMVWVLCPIVLAGAAAIFLMARPLNVVMTGEDRATTLGIDMRKFRTVLFFLTSILVGTIIAVAGPIGFVGIMVPHMCRCITGSDHRILAPVSFLIGAIFLACCDLLAVVLMPVGSIPVGVITSLLGGPFFLLLLIRK